MDNRKRGRPRGKVKTAKIEIVLEPELKTEFMEILKLENKYCSVLIREWIIDYIEKNRNRG